MSALSDDILGEIFGIPKNKSSLQNEENSDSTSEESQEGAYAEVLENNSGQTYNEKASTLNKKIATNNSTPEVEYTDQPPANIIEDVEKKEIKSDIPKPTHGENENEGAEEFDQILRASIQPKHSEPVKDKQVDAEKGIKMDATPSKTSHESERNVRDQPEHGRSNDETEEGEVKHFPAIISKMTKFEWLLDSPGSMYKDLYESKVGCKAIFLSGGEIDFDVANNELLKACVDISHVTVDDRETIASKMKEVQQWRDRIIEVKKHVSSQYYALKSALRLLRGKLSRIHYEKPADPKQEGVNFDHLRDFEIYFARLEALLENCKDVTNNLNNCFETLSRIATLSNLASQSKLLSSYDHHLNQMGIPQSQIRSEMQEIKNSMPKHMSGFDSLEEESVKDESVGNNTPMKKSALTDWTNIH